MKPYSELTRNGRLRRMRKLAELALDEFGLSGAKLTFQHYGGNIIFRVDVAGFKANGDDLFVPNRYSLRVLSMDDFEAVQSELIFLTALRQEAGLPVPEPVPTIDGKMLIKVDALGVPGGRIVTLMRWLDGRILSKGYRPQHFSALGEVIGKLHNFAASWQSPEGFTRLLCDWDNMLGGASFRWSVEELVETMDSSVQEPFRIVSAEVKAVTESLGKGRDAYGLIHADLYPENILFKAGKVRPIDFEDCGYGYWMWDIAAALSEYAWIEGWEWRRDALLAGYNSVRTLPEAQLKQLDLFIAGQYAAMLIWSSAHIKHSPTMQAEYEKWRAKETAGVLRYFE